MNRGNVYKLLSIAVFTFTHGVVAETASFGVKVVDLDTGQPLSGIEVVGWFANSNGWKAWTESAPTYEDRRRTNTEGYCRVSGSTNNGRVGADVDNVPDGYYTHVGNTYQFTQKPMLPLMYWRPTDLVITAKLQRVGHTVPLFVKRMGRKPGSDAIAANGESFAYDLVKGDFMPPFGEGQHADIVFLRLPQEYIGEGFNGRDLRAPRYKNTIKAIFQGDEANGMAVMPSPDAQAFLRIRTAPEGGYLRELSFSESMAYDLQHREGLDRNRCFCFRIRTERDEGGKIKSALYGKMYGDLGFLLDGEDRWMKKVGGISFLYYLNPTPNDRNLEWDRKNNLCPNPGNLGNKLMP